MKKIKCCNNLCSKRINCKKAQTEKIFDTYKWFDKDVENCFEKRENIKYKLQEEKSAVEISHENYLAQKDKLFEVVLQNAYNRIQREYSVSRSYYFRFHVNKVAEFSEEYVYDYCDRKGKRIADVLKTNIV